MGGPLAGIKVVELAGLGPGPFACMVLADLGADVLRIDRISGGHQSRPPEHELVHRGRQSVALDLKRPEAVAVVRELVDSADVLVEGFRPGVAERLGLGPEELCARNPRLIYGRVTGWGQQGPRSDQVGHDINYIGLVGTLHAIGEQGRKPVPPLNLVGDYAGGSMFLVAGVLAALVERASSQLGQVIDAAMVDGAAVLMALSLGMKSAGLMGGERGTNTLDGGAPFYDTYPCADDRYVAVGALEAPFYDCLLRGLAEVAPEVVAALPARDDRGSWPALREGLASVFALRDRDQWLTTFTGTDACVSPVLTLEEAAVDWHLVERSTYVPAEAGGHQPRPAPRFSRSAVDLPSAPTAVGADTRAALVRWGITEHAVSQLLASGAALQT